LSEASQAEPKSFAPIIDRGDEIRNALEEFSQAQKRVDSGFKAIGAVSYAKFEAVQLGNEKVPNSERTLDVSSQISNVSRVCHTGSRAGI
jgi:hypothetical protein